MSRFYYTETPDGVMIIDLETNNSCHVNEDYLLQYESEESRADVLQYFSHLMLDAWRVNLDNLAVTVRKAHD